MGNVTRGNPSLMKRKKSAFLPLWRSGSPSLIIFVGWHPTGLAVASLVSKVVLVTVWATQNNFFRWTELKPLINPPVEAFSLLRVLVLELSDEKILLLGLGNSDGWIQALVLVSELVWSSPCPFPLTLRGGQQLLSWQSAMRCAQSVLINGWSFSGAGCGYIFISASI